MNTQPQTPYVVVGVDGSFSNLGALRYAAAEAASLGAALQLVHVVPDYLPVSPMVPQTPVDLAQLGAGVLEQAAARVRAMDSELSVGTWLRHGTRPVRLTQAAEDAELLVVGRDDRPLLERLLRGDTATGVAARSSVPVVQVPAAWDPADRRTVVVGVKSPTHAPEMLADAFAVARRRGATLVVVHAWKLPSAYDDIIEVRVDLASWTREATAEMEALLRDWRTAYPDVEVEVRIVHDHASHALVAASRQADLVVIARRQHGMPAATHLGGTARTVLRAAECPVRVVAPADAPPIPSLTVEESGQLAR